MFMKRSDKSTPNSNSEKTFFLNQRATANFLLEFPVSDLERKTRETAKVWKLC
jgi:hypothetical protein